MENKRNIRRSIRGLQRVKTWQLVLLVVLFALISATFLRLNNIGMIERRTAVLNADDQGDSATIQARLFDLQRYSAAHMNASSGVVYLEGQYKRDVKKAVAASSDAATSNKKTIADRQYAYRECAKSFSYYSYPWTLCIGEKLAQRLKETGGMTDGTTGLPSPSLYRQEVTSPVWSPDFAGFSVLITAFLILLIFLRLLGLLLLRWLLRRHYQSI